MLKINQKVVNWTIVLTFCTAVAVLAVQLQKVNAEKDELEEDKDELDGRVTDLEGEKESIEHELEIKKDELKEQEEVVSKSKKETKNTKKKNKELEKIVKEKDKTIENKNSEINKLKNSTTGVKSENKKGKKGRKTTMNVTAYTAGAESTGKSPGDSGYGKTASGKMVQEGVTIACPPSIPFGTEIEIESVGKRVCQDRGGAITEGHLDVYMASISETKNFGRQNLQVKILN